MPVAFLTTIPMLVVGLIPAGVAPVLFEAPSLLVAAISVDVSRFAIGPLIVRRSLIVCGPLVYGSRSLLSGIMN